MRRAEVLATPEAADLSNDSEIHGLGCVQTMASLTARLGRAARTVVGVAAASCSQGTAAFSLMLRVVTRQLQEWGAVAASRGVIQQAVRLSQQENAAVRKDHHRRPQVLSRA